MKNKKNPKKSDNEYLMAIKIRSVNPWLPVAEIAEELKDDERRVRDRLLKLADDAINGSVLEKKIHGNNLYFRLKT